MALIDRPSRRASKRTSDGPVKVGTISRKDYQQRALDPAVRARVARAVARFGPTVEAARAEADERES